MSGSIGEEAPANPIRGAIWEDRSVEGRLRIFRPGAGDETVSGESVFVNGPSYSGMEDNDIRGFLDGRFYNGWNQPSQSHVRVGRVGLWPGSSAPADRSPVYGEFELFRFLQRWDEIRLPEGARVTGASLTLQVERGCTESLRLFLYPVWREWNPGRGGVHGNNVSKPRPGEVWWNAAAHEEEPWGLPGAGLASRRDPRADTDALALAGAVYEPDHSEVVFTSGRLAEYVEQKIEEGEPLRFLIKMSDYLEDIPGAQLAFYSANYGASRDPARRPRLEIGWECEDAHLELEEEVLLEGGRSVTLGPMEVGREDDLFVSFDGHPDSPDPTILVQEGDGADPGGWEPVSGLVRPKRGPVWIQIRACEDLVALGEEFHDELRHTWITEGVPEDGRVEWVFISPRGEEQHRAGSYTGDYTWTVRFDPGDPGPWRYRWEHDLGGDLERGPESRFRVVATGVDAVREALAQLAKDVESSAAGRHSRERDPYRIRFSRLVREAARLESGSTGGSEGLHDLMDDLDEVRSIIWGRELPDEIPLRSLPLRGEVDGRQLRDPVPDLRDDGSVLSDGVRRLRRRIGQLRRFLSRRS